MIEQYEIRLAVADDVNRIAEMSRDTIEQGLGWRWTPKRVLGNLNDKDTNVLVAFDHQCLIGFGIMKYSYEEAHLMLLAVADSYRRRGIGSALLAWLEGSALTAGIGCVYLEARLVNTSARRFYRRLGYREIRKINGYYLGREDAIQIAKDLWA